MAALHQAGHEGDVARTDQESRLGSLEPAHHLSSAGARLRGTPAVYRPWRTRCWSAWGGAVAALVHSAGYLLVTGAMAVVVYERVGLGFPGKGRIDLDLIWSLALVLTGLATLAL